MNVKKKVIEKIIRQGISSPKDLERTKRQVMKELKTTSPSNVDLLKTYHKLTLKEREEIFLRYRKTFDKERDREIKELLKTRPVRSLSGIVNVSVLTKPYPCPGKCIFCPSEEGTPKSYLKDEPAVMRALMNQYDPQKQVETRIKSLRITGHPLGKIELRIIGGTWSFYPPRYQSNFIKKCFDACNNKESKTLKEAQERNEKSKHRIVGLSVETRPDFITPKEIRRLRNFGVTAVELGVQTIYDDILKKIKRGHKVSKTIEATQMLKDAGFKVCYQMMPNLPGSNAKKDIGMFRVLFEDSSFQPDYLKIYPTIILEKTELYNLWKKKKHKPYTDKQLKKILKEIKGNIPYYVRIQRLIRDISAQNVKAGTKTSNLRQILSLESEKENWRCNCIRCREIKGNYDPGKKLEIFREDYSASKGVEIFLSIEDKERKNLFSLLRLRIPSDFSSRKTAILRELHTYGQQLPVNSRKNSSPQHKGLGKKLMKLAENIAFNDFGAKKMAVISAIGARNYYRKLGYSLKNTYMIKTISPF